MTQAVNLANFANSLNSSGQLDPSNFSSVVPVAKGGTGASSAAGAASNLAAEIGKLLYPVGSIYINAASITNPSILLGFGTWIEFGSGRVLVGQNTGDASFDALEETGGSKDAVVVSHTHTASVTDPGHTHSFTAVQNVSGDRYAGGGVGASTSTSTNSATTGISVTNSSTGVSGTNANLQPYVVVKMWKRTA